ncbi:hypothetical protein KP509_21G065900 [Ceratopteris richardii]|uniref:CCHC-type domain-containing protein n=1 Tax=Ceratopteris richardii TaxID=49495 RepID=A0A8T2SDQ0_CERRI|nr:hypothetical protein KP509_21G065900 [Ceratopteris richardii]
MDYLRQGFNESIDNYIQRMETLVRKMGANAPNDETWKRRFIARLKDLMTQQHISLTRPTTLIAAKEQARLWEEVQLCQQRKIELLYKPMGGPGNVPMKDPGQGSPTLMTPAFVAATSTPGEVKPVLTEEQILKLITQAIRAATITQETYRVKQEVTTNPNQVFRSNTWCGKCHGYGHLASECPTVSRVFTDRSPARMRCTFCRRTNHTEDQCYNKRAYEEQTMKLGDTRERSYTRLPAQSVPPTSHWENRQTYGYGAQATTGKDKGPVRSSNYVETQMHSTPRAQEHGKKAHKEPTVAVVTRTQEYLKRNPEGKSENDSQEKISKHVEVENQVRGFAEQQEFEDGEKIEILPPVTKEFVRGIAPFPERLRVPKCQKERQSLEEVDIVKLLADMEVTLDIGILLKCSPTYRRQFYNEYIKKPRKARDKKRQDKDVQGMIESITMQIDSNAPAVTIEIKGYAVPGAQLDSGAAINLMTEYMMKALGLNHMEETPMSLRIVDQTHVKPPGFLKTVSTVVGGLEFKVDYLIVRPRTSEATFSILLGQPWLIQANCVHDWHTGFISIGPKSDRFNFKCLQTRLARNRRQLRK